MRKNLWMAAAFVPLLLACNSRHSESTAERANSVTNSGAAKTDSVDYSVFTEVFRVKDGNNAIMFAHKHYLSYHFEMNGSVTEGELNTERGYGEDKDATLYVLNPSQSVSEQKYIVRLTSGKVIMLDSLRRLTGTEMLRVN